MALTFSPPARQCLPPEARDEEARPAPHLATVGSQAKRRQEKALPGRKGPELGWQRLTCPAARLGLADSGWGQGAAEGLRVSSFLTGQ